jgi:hypothetical protein
MRLARLERRDVDNTKRHDEIEETLTTLLSFVDSWTSTTRRTRREPWSPLEAPTRGGCARGCRTDATAQANRQMYESTSARR